MNSELFPEGEWVDQDHIDVLWVLTTLLWTSDILESYGRCPFLPTEADNILDTCENGDRLGNDFLYPLIVACNIQQMVIDLKFLRI